jgi:multidrug efflux pump subunit AcrA (membrane-fusion protein)
MARICARAEPCRSVSFFCAIGLPLVVTALLLAGCQRETEASAPEIRPVRTVTVAKRDVGEIVSYTGRIEAEIETRLSFRIGGRMIERSVRVGDRVEPGQVTASADKTARIWDAMSAALRGDRDDQVTFAAFKADGSRIVTAGVPVQEPFKS